VNHVANERDGDRTVLKRFSGIFAFLMVVVLIGSMFLFLAVHDRNKAFDSENQIWLPGHTAAAELLIATVDQETGMRGFVITGAEEFLEPYTMGRQRSTAALATVRTLFAGDDELLALVGNVSVDLQTWQTKFAEPSISVARFDLETARNRVATGRGKAAFDQLRNSVLDLSTAIDRGLADSKERSANAFTLLFITAIIVGGILIVVAVVLLDRSRRWLTQAATLERRLRSTITAVQASLLPATIPEFDHVEVALAYRPASTDADVGGDFYDLNTSKSGLVTISIGDVCGHDIHAAIVTGLARHTINAASQHLIDPADVLRWANQALNSHDTGGRFVSAAHAHLHPPEPRRACVSRHRARRPPLPHPDRRRRPTSFRDRHSRNAARHHRRPEDHHHPHHARPRRPTPFLHRRPHREQPTAAQHRRPPHRHRQQQKKHRRRDTDLVDAALRHTRSTKQTRRRCRRHHPTPTRRQPRNRGP